MACFSVFIHKWSNSVNSSTEFIFGIADSLFLTWPAGYATSRWLAARCHAFELTSWIAVEPISRRYSRAESGWFRSLPHSKAAWPHPKPLVWGELKAGLRREFSNQILKSCCIAHTHNEKFLRFSSPEFHTQLKNNEACHTTGDLFTSRQKRQCTASLALSWDGEASINPLSIIAYPMQRWEVRHKEELLETLTFILTGNLETSIKLACFCVGGSVSTWREHTK